MNTAYHTTVERSHIATAAKTTPWPVKALRERLGAKWSVEAHRNAGGTAYNVMNEDGSLFADVERYPSGWVAFIGKGRTMRGFDTISGLAEEFRAIAGDNGCAT